MPLLGNLATDSSGTEPSPAIWDRISIGDILKGKLKFFREDFNAFGLTTAVSSNVGRYHGQQLWYSYESAAADIVTQLATDANGVAQCSIAATSNNEQWLQGGNSTSVMFVPKTTANGGRSIFFECRINKSVLTGNAFFGLAEEGSAADNFIADDGASLADKDYIGFLVLEGAPTVVRLVYHKASGTMTNIAATFHTLVANEFVKLGFVIDMEEYDLRKRIKSYLNGVEQASVLTNTLYENTTDFPTGEEMSPIWGGKNVGEANIVRADWIQCAQYKES